MLATQSSSMTLYGLVGSDYGTVQYQIWNCLCDQQWSELARPKNHRHRGIYFWCTVAFPI